MLHVVVYDPGPIWSLRYLVGIEPTITVTPNPSCMTFEGRSCVTISPRIPDDRTTAILQHRTY